MTTLGESRLETLLVGWASNEVDLFKFNHLDEVAVEVLAVGDVCLERITSVSRLSSVLIPVSVDRGIDGHVLLVELLEGQFVERDGGDRGVGLVAFEGGVGNERGYILLQLCQVLDHVVLGEREAVFVAHFLGHQHEEATLLEHQYHLFDVLLGTGESFFYFAILQVATLDFLLNHCNF